MRGHTDLVTGVAHLPDGRRIITCSDDGSLRLWDLESGVQIDNDWRDDGKEGVWNISLSPNGKTVASGSSDGKVRLWDVETKKVVVRWTGHTSTVRSLCWSADGGRVVSGSDDGTIRVWDVESGNTVLGPIKTGHLYLSAVIYSPDTTKIATGGLDETSLKIWDAKTGNLLSTIKHDEQIWSMDLGSKEAYHRIRYHYDIRHRHMAANRHPGGSPIHCVLSLLVSERLPTWEWIVRCNSASMESRYESPSRSTHPASSLCL